MIGSTINNKYRIDRELGRGGMGVVYEAHDTLLHRTVALKIMNPELAGRKDLLQRFLSEAQILVRLDDPRIVKVYDLQVMTPGFFIVMEYVKGLTLARKIKPLETEPETIPLPYQEALPIFKQTLHAIEYAHQAGILHRDLKPSNIMLTPGSGVKVMDFGLAKNPQEVDLTQSQEVLGTPVYMPPEQIKGLKQTDRRSDIYALGMTFYEMLTGRWPFPAQENYFALLHVILNEEFPSPNRFNAAVPKALAKIVMKALEKKPERRFQTAGEMLAAIAKFEQDTLTLPPPPPVPPPPPPPNGVNKRIWLTLAAAALLLVVALGVNKFLENSSLPRQPNPVAASTSASDSTKNLPARRHSPLMLELAGITDTPALLNKLSVYQRETKLTAGKKDDFESVEGCYLFVCDAQNVLGVFRFKENVYYAVNSTASYADLSQKFSGKTAIWVREQSVP
jgi:serine/threonine protein kinase